MFKTSWNLGKKIYFLTVNFECKYRSSISAENLASKFQCALSLKCIVAFEDLLKLISFKFH